MSIRLFGVASLAILVLFGPPHAAGQEKEKGKSTPIDPRGEPDNVAAKQPFGYTVWVGPGGWHLRAFNNDKKKKDRRFHGTIKVEGGTVETVNGVGLEGKGKDKWKLNSDRTMLDFDLKTQGLEGFDVRLSRDTKNMRFDLEIDGKHDTGHVWIGDHAAHPSKSPFTFHAHAHAGLPLGFAAGEPASYGIWNHGEHWRLRTTTAKASHRFHGKVVVTGGAIDGIEAIRLEDKGSLIDRWRLSSDRREVNFDFRTKGEIDGIDFRVSPKSDKLTWDVHIDGRHTPERVFVGTSGNHPERIPFSMPALGKK